MTHKGLEVLQFPTYPDWIKWLEKNAANYSSAVWIKLAKKDSGITSITYEELREGCLIYGWIDSVVNSLDSKEYLQKVSPRRQKSIWSKINRNIVENLIIENKMKPGGLKEVEAAKSDGRWERAYDSPKDMKVPNDFVKELRKYPDAFEFYSTLTKANTFAIAFRLNTAVKPETRKRRFEALLSLMKAKEKIY